jgi:hypothetical protein
MKFNIFGGVASMMNNHELGEETATIFLNKN